MPAQRVEQWVEPVAKVKLRSAAVGWLRWSASMAQNPPIEHLTQRRT